MDTLILKIKSAAATLLPKVIAIRRHLHKHPELSFQETQTSLYIQSVLKEHQIEFTSGHVKTGIVARIKGNTPGKTLALRADIDALPIEEKNKTPYTSINKGIMHACGHDAHTASLLGTAILLNQFKEHIKGEIIFVFQPGEELLPGGASLMLKENALGKKLPSAIIGQHVFPQLQSGKVGFKKGLYMASTDELYLTVKGKGGHGAMPNLCIDPILIASHIIIALQQISSRYAPPQIPTVLSVGKIIGNGATNVIPDEIYLEGTFRTFNEDWRKKAHSLITQIAQTTAQSFGAFCDVRIEKGYPFLINDENVTTQCINAATNYLGKENVVELDLRTTAEDFAFYSQVMPGCFYRLGTGNLAKKNTNVHTATFDIDETSLETACGLMTYLAIQYLHNPPTRK